MDKKEYELVSDGKIKGEVENVRFAWRPLEVSNRLQDQTSQFQLFLPSFFHSGLPDRIPSELLQTCCTYPC